MGVLVKNSNVPIALPILTVSNQPTTFPKEGYCDTAFLTNLGAAQKNAAFALKPKEDIVQFIIDWFDQSSDARMNI